MFIDTRCSPFSTGGNTGGIEFDSSACDVGEGARHALVAAGLFFIALVLSCIIPKPLPLVRVIREMERNKRFDSCCACCGDILLCSDADDTCCPGISAVFCCCGGRRSKKKNAFDDEKDQEGMELTVPLSLGDQEIVMDTTRSCIQTVSR